MLFRFILVLVVAAGAWWVVRKLRGPQHLRVPSEWRALARNSTTVAEALTLRQQTVSLIRSRKSGLSDSLVLEIDALVQSVVNLAQAQYDVKQALDRAGVNVSNDEGHARIQKALDDAMASLVEAHKHLVEIAESAHSESLESLASRIEVETSELKMSVRAHKDAVKMVALLDAPSPAADEVDESLATPEEPEAS